MDNEELSLSVGLAWLLAILTVVAAGVVIFTIGVVEVPPYYGASYTRQMINWPIVIWCAVGAIYALLYAQLFSNVGAISKKSDRILQMLQSRNQAAITAPLVSGDVIENSSGDTLLSADTISTQPTKEDVKEPVISGGVVFAVVALVIVVLISVSYMKN